MEKDLVYGRNDLNKFREWISLNVVEMTWQGKNLQEFEEFWSLVFDEGLTLSNLVKRLSLCHKWVQSSPLASWLIWLKNRLIIFSFIESDLNLVQISERCEISVGELARILRDFFVEFYPHLDDDLSEFFQISLPIDAKAKSDFKLVQSQLALSTLEKGSKSDEIMISLEITLFEAWPPLLQKCRKSFGKVDDIANQSLEVIEGNSHIKILRDTFLIVIVAIILLFVVKWFNQRYEKFMTDSISIYEPQFDWLNKSLIFKSVENMNAQNVKIDVKDIDEVDDSKNPFGKNLEEERFETESEVSITSWAELPRDFDQANLEKSEYEETSGQNYRENRYGNTKVYRVMMKAVDMMRAKDKLLNLMNQYNVTQVDNVKPGMSVPGGMYFNLYVPREFLKEFLAQVMEVDESILYESQARVYKNPIGKNRVFIWVKDI
ncbi:MAG: hypothetical protein Fur0010_04280 [Bdellovibrio sp.]